MTFQRRNKFHAVRTALMGRTFDSKAEADRAAILHLLERAGEISDLQYQVTFRLTDAEITYRADFVYVERGRVVVEDVKGVMTDRFRIICKLWSRYGSGVLRVVTRRGAAAWRTVKEIPGQ